VARCFRRNSPMFVSCRRMSIVRETVRFEARLALTRGGGGQRIPEGAEQPCAAI
jgi:hypothetical protein